MTTIIFCRYANFLFGYVLNFILKGRCKVLSLSDIYVCDSDFSVVYFSVSACDLNVCALVRQMHVIICYCLVTMGSTNYLLKSQLVLSFFYYYL